MIEAINVIIDYVGNMSVIENDTKENITATSSSESNNTSMKNKDENDKD